MSTHHLHDSPQAPHFVAYRYQTGMGPRTGRAQVVDMEAAQALVKLLRGNPAVTLCAIVQPDRPYALNAAEYAKRLASALDIARAAGSNLAARGAAFAEYHDPRYGEA